VLGAQLQSPTALFPGKMTPIIFNLMMMMMIIIIIIINITIQKSVECESWSHFACWLMFHNSLHESGSVHATNTLHHFIFLALDFFDKTGCDFSSFRK
jgi:hypothetical protein